MELIKIEVNDAKTPKDEIIATIEDADITLMDMGEMCQVLVGAAEESKNSRLLAMARIFAELIFSVRSILDDACRQVYLYDLRKGA